MVKKADIHLKLLIHKTTLLNGRVTPPSSKSQTIRGLIFATLASGQSTLNNVLDSEDAEDAIRVCQQLGVKITRENNKKIIIESDGLPLQTNINTVYTGNSGITTRFIFPLLGFRQNNQEPILLDCGEQMRARPIWPLVTALSHLGLNVQYMEKEGSCPIRISGHLRGGIAEVDGLSSQYLSALLIALPCAENDSQVTVRNLHERPYIEITLQWLQEQHIHYTHKNNADEDIFTIKGKQRYQSFQKNISGDFSSASYLIAAAVLLDGRVELKGLDMQDTQGDKRLITILQDMGADIAIESQQIIIHGGRTLTGIKIDANDIPDLLPVLAVIGTQSFGKTEIHNVKQARIKETDRIHSMREGLEKMGAHVEEYPDGLTVYQSELRGAKVRGFDDHRTVMSLALAGMLATDDTYIDDAQAIQKTFPTFVEIMQSIGAKMEFAA